MKNSIRILILLLLCTIFLPSCNITVESRISDFGSHTTDIPQISAIPTPSTAATHDIAKTPKPTQIFTLDPTAKNTLHPFLNSYLAYFNQKSNALNAILEIIDNTDADPQVYAPILEPMSIINSGDKKFIYMIELKNGTDNLTSKFSSDHLISVSYENEEGQHILKYIDEDGKPYQLTAEYDPDTFSARLILEDSSSQVVKLLEYVQFETQFIAQYVLPGEKNISITCHITNDSTSFGLVETDTMPDSIYKSTAYPMQFGKNESMYFTISGDTLTIINQSVQSIVRKGS